MIWITFIFFGYMLISSIWNSIFECSHPVKLSTYLEAYVIPRTLLSFRALSISNLCLVELDGTHCYNKIMRIMEEWKFIIIFPFYNSSYIVTFEKYSAFPRKQIVNKFRRAVTNMFKGMLPGCGRSFKSDVSKLSSSGR